MQTLKQEHVYVLQIVQIIQEVGAEIYMVILWHKVVYQNVLNHWHGQIFKQEIVKVYVQHYQFQHILKTLTWDVFYL